MKKFGFVVNFDASLNGIIFENYSYMFRLFPKDYEPVLIFFKNVHVNKILPNIEKAKEFVSQEKFFSKSTTKTILISSYEDFSKLDELKFLVTNYNFHAYFGGKIDDTVNLVYCAMSYFSHTGKKIFIRQGDSSFRVRDHFEEAHNQNDKFLKENETAIKYLNKFNIIDYDNVRWLLNGNRSIKHWGPMSIESVYCPKDEYFIYIKDDIFFNIDLTCEKYKFLTSTEKNNKLVHIGFFSGPAVYKKALLKKILINSKIECDVFGNLTDDYEINNPKITLNRFLLKRDEFFETMSRYSFYFTVGKKGMNYTNKTLYDAMAVGTINLIYAPMDKNKSILKKDEYYFEDVNSLIERANLFNSKYQDILADQKEILYSTMTKKDKIYENEL